MFPIQERKEVMDYTELKKLMSEQKVEMTAAERIKAYNEGKEVDHYRHLIRLWQIFLDLQHHNLRKTLK